MPRNNLSRRRAGFPRTALSLAACSLLGGFSPAALASCPGNQISSAYTITNGNTVACVELVDSLISGVAHGDAAITNMGTVTDGLYVTGNVLWNSPGGNTFGIRGLPGGTFGAIVIADGARVQYSADAGAAATHQQYALAFYGSQATLIDNAGRLGGSTGSGGVVPGSIIGLRLDSATSVGTLLNRATGTIHGQGGPAVQVISGSTISTFNNDGHIEASYDAAVLVNGNGSRITTFNNTGTMSGAIRSESGGLLSTLNNSGTIQPGVLGDAILIEATAAAGTVINNSGALLGRVKLNAASTLNLDGNNARVSGTVNGDALSAVNVKGRFASENTFSVGRLNVASSGVFALGHAVSTQSGFTNEGTVSVVPAATATINGDYTQLANGTLRTTVTDDTTYGKLLVNGTANLPSNARIDVNVTNPNFNFTTAGLLGVLSATTLNSDGSFSVTDNSLLFDFRAIKTGNAVDLVLQAAQASGGGGGGSTQVVNAVVSTSNHPGLGAARVIDDVIAANPGSELASAFVPLTTQQQVSDAVSQTLPLLTGGSMVAANAAFSGINRVVQARIETNRGLSSGDTFLGDGKVWMKPFGSWAGQDNTAGVSGYKASTSGFALGADGTVSAHTRMGAAFAYANSSTDSRSVVAPQRNSVDVFQLIAYGSHSLDERTDVSLQATLGQNRNKGQRHIALTNATASARYESLSAHVGAGIGRSYTVGTRSTLTPSLRADYTWVRDAAYRESGAGALSLNVDRRSTDMLVLGGDLKYSHGFGERTTLVANTGLGYDAFNRQAAITAAFAGAPGAAFVTYGLKQDPWIGRAGLGVVHTTAQGLEITARYDAEFRQRFLNQTASVKLRWAF